MAAMAPRRHEPGSFADFMLRPTGAMIVCVALVMIGLSIEESGTIKRIRIGIALRLLAAAGAAVATCCALALGAPTLSVFMIGFTLVAAGGVLIAYQARFDLAVYEDPRHGQRLRLEKLSADGLVLLAGERMVRIPLGDVTSARVTASASGSGVLLGLKRDSEARREAVPLPWMVIAVEEECFLITEHQAGLDAPLLVECVRAATQAPRAFR
jgi:hypothetical protein